VLLARLAGTGLIVDDASAVVARAPSLALVRLAARR
jgi:hypothetical protein